MERVEFEKRFLALANQSDVVITPANVAYQLDIGIEEAQEHLLELELNGTLKQESDKDGNTIYQMPNRARGANLPMVIDQPQQNQITDPANTPAAPVYASKPADGPHVAPAASGKGVNGLVLNCLVPGVGSLTNGQMIGGAMLGLAFVGILMLFLMPGWSKLTGILPVIGAYIWSIIAGIGLLKS